MNWFEILLLVSLSLFIVLGVFAIIDKLKKARELNRLFKNE